VRITSLKVSDFRSFAGMEPIELGPINVFVGPNNAGKSSLLRAIYMIQGGLPPLDAEVRLGASGSRIELGLSDLRAGSPWGEFDIANLTATIVSGGNLNLELENPHMHAGVQPLQAREPNHVVVPYFSKRKAVAYQEDVREENALSISPNFDYLAAKLSRLGNASFPAGERYRDTCKAILGFVVTAVPSRNGQLPGAYMADRRTIPLSQMGEGVPNIVGLLADLALSEQKILLIEEPENDLHPSALKALLGLIEESASVNQVFVSTHSNIVVRHLGGIADGRLFYVDTEPGSLPPVATVQPIEPTPEARVAVLRDLGYSFSDFDLWDGWLILEESSAERIVRDYLIPWFAPRLSRVRTLSAGGNAEVEPTFDDFHRLVRFTHLEEAYRDAAWVRVDGDAHGEEIVGRLRGRYPSWTPDRFATFSEPQFERYYPEEFAGKVEAALTAGDKRARRAAKKALLDEVRAWLDEDPQRGQTALERSAAPVIEELRKIETDLFAPSA